MNGSLDLWLRNRTGALELLDWDKGFQIASGAARGLAFLHHGFIPHIIHRDIKASNILLNEDFEPKVQFRIPLQRLTKGIRFSFTLGETENSISGEALVVAGGRGKAFSGPVNGES